MCILTSIKAKALWLTLFLAFLPVTTVLASPQNGGGIAIIVSAQEKWNGLNRKLGLRQIARIYRKQIVLDKEGRRIHPVNLSARHLLRQQLSQRLFRKSPRAMANYWNERYFQGVSPPHVVASQEAMIRFVAATPGAIGYVASCMVDNRVRVLLTLKPKNKISDALCHPSRKTAAK